MTDYLVYKVGGELILHSHCQDAEEDLLLHDMIPGEDVVVVTDPAREGSETLEAAATREARMYFRGEHQEPKRIDCWVTGALNGRSALRQARQATARNLGADFVVLVHPGLLMQGHHHPRRTKS